MSPMQYRRLLIVPVIVSLWGAGWRVSLAGALPVRVAPVEAGTWSREITVLGSVESIGKLTLDTPVAGRVMGPFLPPGRIGKGAVIARVAPPGLVAQTQAARVRVAYAHTQLARARRLYKDGVVARQDVDQARLALAQAGSSLSAFEAQAGQQVLTAPFTGVLRYLVPPGAVVDAGSPIARLTGRAEPWVEAYVTPGQARALVPGGLAAIQAHGWRGAGRIRSVGSSARHMGLVSVYVALPHASPLLPGQWVSLTLKGAGGRAFKVPTQAVVMQGADAQVYTIHNGRAHAISVRVVASHDGETWVRGPLQSGEAVVVSGSGLVASDTPVAIQR
ncbi:MAG: efflux RND transporter periplasmic adaptor subunit [Betaproteobacteria bacterium]|nr:efflux RND transporter periplasmic adaptor subunit [Betaproteobacteria bacterium]